LLLIEHDALSRATIFGFSGDDHFVVGFAARQAAFFGCEFQGFFAVELSLVDEFFDALGETLHGIGRGTSVGGILGADEQRDFAFGGSLFERGEELGEFAAAEFFVELGDFAGDAGGAVAENFTGVSDTFRDAVRSFVKNDGAILDAQALEGAAAFAAAIREKAYKEKFFIGEPTGGQRRKKCRWPGNRNDGNMMAEAESDEAMARIGNQRHARVADERDFRALFERDEQFGGARHFIVLVVADERFANFVVAEELLCVACVFAGDLIDFFQDAQGAEGDVLQIAYGRANEV